MQQITLRLREETIEAVEVEADDAGVTRSEHLRDIIESRNEHEEDLEEMREELDELRTEVERLRNEKRALIADREEKQELVEYVESERQLAEERASANIVERTKWAIFGKSEK